MNTQKNIILAPYTTFGIGGPADMFVTVHSAGELGQAVQYAQEHSLSFFVLGSGANILIGDKGFRGLVVKNEASRVLLNDSEGSSQKEDSSAAPQNDNIFLTAESGITIAELIEITKEKGLSGLEHFAGIPSTLGGALWQNLHFLNPDRSQTVFIGDLVEESVILSVSEGSSQPNKEDSSVTPQNDKIKTVSHDYFKFAYDYSILHDTHDIVLSATLRLQKEDPENIQQRIDANVAWRAAKHPENAVHTSAGSVFKKLEGYGAGRLIEKVGLKGHEIGGAKISEKHANFIINTGNATAADVRALITLVQKKIKEELGLDLQTEISFVGEF